MAGQLRGCSRGAEIPEWIRWPVRIAPKPVNPTPIRRGDDGILAHDLAVKCGVLERGRAYGHGDALAGRYVTPVHDGEPRAAVTAQALERLFRACGALPDAPDGAPAEAAPETPGTSGTATKAIS